MRQWLGLGGSFLYIFAVIGVAQALLASGRLSAASTRKVVHIGVAHWWIIAMLFIDDLAIALIGPVSFIIINAWSYRTHFFHAMEHAEPRRNLGTIYFPVALTLLVLLTWSGLFPRWYGLIAILTLGWGDGLASLLGESLGSRDGWIRFRIAGGTKSLVGTAAMFFASLAVVGGTIAAVQVIGLDGGGTGVDRLASGLARLVASLRGDAWVSSSSDGLVVQAVARVEMLAEAWVRDRTHLLASLWPTHPAHIVAIAFIVAAVATATELVTPWGLDNISVPLAVFATLAMTLVLPWAWTVRLAFAVGLNIAVALVAWMRGSVSPSGSVAGALVGALIYMAGGLFYWSVLMAFFISSSLLGRLRVGAKGQSRRDEATSIHAKDNRRDALQVLANGGLAAAMAGASVITGRPIFALGFAIAMAAANADTWASEIGVLSSARPVSILTMKPIRRGTSGGVTVLGIFAALAGALFVALWFAVGYWLVHGFNGMEIGAMIAAITGGGFLGSILDSVLGATIQAQYWDSHRGIHTEQTVDHRGTPFELVRGVAVIGNDAVNALSGVLATGVLLALVM